MQIKKLCNSFFMHILSPFYGDKVMYTLIIVVGYHCAVNTNIVHYSYEMWKNSNVR